MPTEDKLTIQECFLEWEAVIADIDQNGITLVNHRDLIQKKTQMLLAIQQTRKDIKNAELELKAKENKMIQELIDEWAKKTPAKDDVMNLTREDRYSLINREVDVDTMMEIAKNRTYHIRIGEIDLNKVGVGLDPQI